jgi:carboxyl-terminal processing protease
LDDKRDRLNAEYNNYETFQSKYQVSNTLLEQVVDYGVSKDIPKDEQLVNQHRAALKLEIKACIADQLYGDMAYYQTIFTTDKMVNRAVEEIERVGSTTAAPSALKMEEQGI